MLLLSRFKIIGHSMEPTLKYGSTVLASNIPYLFFPPRVGDVIVFADGREEIFIKRIKDKRGSAYFLAGDNARDSLDSEKLGWVERKIS